MEPCILFLCLSLRDATPGNKDAATFPRYRRENMHKELVSIALKSRFECGQQEGESSHAPVHTTSMNRTSERPNACGIEIVWIELASSGRASDTQTSRFQYCIIGKYKVLWTAVSGYHTCKKMPQVQQLFLANGFLWLPCYACSWQSDGTNLLHTNSLCVWQEWNGSLLNCGRFWLISKGFEPLTT